MIEVNNISKTFYSSGGIFSGSNREIKALDDVSLSLEEGKILGIVGESGSGKTTLGKCILRLHTLDSGNITIDDHDINRYSRKEFSTMVQMIFQDPFSSLNPKLSVETILSEASELNNKKAVHEEVLSVLNSVGLNESILHNYPHQFSGGQRQRVALARALMKKPRFIVADEPLSSLDVSIGNQLLNLFISLKNSDNMSFVFISHDIAATASIADTVIVMHNGKIVEAGDCMEVIKNPKEEYTKNLISAVPVL